LFNRWFSWFRLRRSTPRVVRRPASPPGPQLFLVVEGRHDVEFLKRIAVLLHADDPSLPDLAGLERAGIILFVPAGGGDFRPWSTRLAPLGLAEFHLYDREIFPESERRRAWAALVNSRPRSRAFVTSRRSLENYLHPAAICEVRGVSLAYSADDDVADLSARALFTPSSNAAAWEDLSRRARRRLRDRAKSWLNTTAVERMTVGRLREQDPDGEVAGWLRVIDELLAA
jgi:hypothetical protein